jgi:hypothetical protein
MQLHRIILAERNITLKKAIEYNLALPKFDQQGLISGKNYFQVLKPNRF